MKFYPACEYPACESSYESLTCLYEILSRLCVTVPSGLYGNCWYVIMKFHLEGKLLCVFWALCKLLICFHEIPSRECVAMYHLSSMWIADMLVKSHIACVLLCISWPLFGSLTWLWNFIQLVSCCASSGLYLNHQHVYENLSSLWATVHLLGFIWIADMLLWNFIQRVSCCALSGLYVDCWYASMNII